MDKSTSNPIITFLLVITPVFADCTEPYYIEANVLSNGDMEIRELKVLSGDYNGLSTNLKYQNNYQKQQQLALIYYPSLSY